jgi:hypothetical protein
MTVILTTHYMKDVAALCERLKDSPVNGTSAPVFRLTDCP